MRVLLIVVLMVIAANCLAQERYFPKLEEGRHIVIAGRVVDLELIKIYTTSGQEVDICEVTVQADTTLFGPHQPERKFLSNNILYIKDNRVGIAESASDNSFWFRMNDNVLVVATQSKGRKVGDSSSRDFYSIRYARFFRERCNNLQQVCLKQGGIEYNWHVDVSNVSYRDLYEMVLDPTWIEEDRNLEDLIKVISGE